MKALRGILALGLVSALASVGLGLLPTAMAAHGNAPPPKAVDLIWANGQLWDSVLLGALHGNVPPQTLDALYMVAGQNPVSAAAPGDSDYNGGRWLPTVLAWVGAGAPPLFTDGEQVEASMAAGDLVVVGTGSPFLCPLTNPNNS
ncbi:MAG TPA: hypothetical protein VJ397_03445 [Thermoplasmata archaeon]|nr:hypothetical protein [Thermoplasmata archaeon]